MTTTTESEKVTRLRELAVECDNYRRERDWSDARLYKEIPHIGSTKTFKKLLDGDTDELNVETQLRNYETAAEMVKSLRARDLPPEPEYDHFRNVLNVLSATSRAWNEPGISRAVIVAGANGTGKSTAKRALLKRWGKVVVNCEADETWRDSLNVPYGEIIEALSIRKKAENGEAWKMPLYPPARQSLILEQLNSRKLILVIDECHRMGPRGLNMVTTLINKSLVVPVLFGLPVLINRLFTSAYEEAIQLTGNRLGERVTLESPAVDETLEMFERRGVKFDTKETEGVAAKKITAEAPFFGNWQFVKKVHRECFRLAGTKPLTHPQFEQAFTTARSRCVQEQKRS